MRLLHSFKKLCEEEEAISTMPQHFNVSLDCMKTWKYHAGDRSYKSRGVVSGSCIKIRDDMKGMGRDVGVVWVGSASGVEMGVSIGATGGWAAT